MNLVFDEFLREFRHESGDFSKSANLEISKFAEEKEKERERVSRDGRRKNLQKKRNELKRLDDLIAAADREIRTRILAEDEAERRKRSKEMFDRWIQDAISKREK